MEDKWVTVSGVKTNFIHGGKGKALVLLPGWPSNFSTGDQVLNNLAKYFEIFAINLPGFGKTEPLPNPESLEINDLSEFIYSAIKNLQVKSFFLMGFSMGGLTSLSLSANHPEAVSKMICIAPPLGISFLPQKMRVIFFLVKILGQFSVFLALLKKIINNNYIFPKLYYAFTSYSYTDEDSRQDYLQNRENLRNMDFSQCLRTLKILDHLNALNFSKNITAETLILVANDDTFVGKSPLKLRGIIPHNESIVLNTQHWGIMEAYPPKKISEFFNSRC